MILVNKHCSATFYPAMADTALLHHYKVLKQFLDISDDLLSRAKTNSSRAARAREKLLKLSGAQFRELSTDVYDELRRRIDESRSEPDFLLPKLTFHPKRNQARQKLSSLPQLRFKDLVSDISYEIERRHLHLPPGPEQHPVDSALLLSTHTSETALALPGDHSRSHSRLQSQQSDFRSMDRSSLKHRSSQVLGSDTASQTRNRASRQSNASFSTLEGSQIANSTALQDEITTPDTRSQVAQQSIGIQATTVVPTKASMTWSSDEEDGLENQDTSEKARRISFPNSFALPKPAPPRALDEPVDTGLDDQLEKLRLENESRAKALSDVQEQLAQTQGEKSRLQDSLEALQISHRNVLQEKESLLLQIKELKETNASRDAQSQPQIQELSAQNSALRLEITALQARLSQSALAGAKLVTASRNLNLSADMKTFFDKLELLPSTDIPKERKLKEDLLKNEVSQWQRKFESQRNDEVMSQIRSLTSNKQLHNMVSSNGRIPMKRAIEFFSLVDVFISALQIAEPNPDLLFEKISIIAIDANKISSLGHAHALSDNGQADGIREAASHVLTSTRYFVTHSALFPKSIVERSVAELAFAMCDFISKHKILTEDGLPQISNALEPKDLEFSPVIKPLRMQKRSVVHEDTSPVTHNASKTAYSPRAKSVETTAFEPRSPQAAKASILDKMKKFEEQSPQPISLDDTSDKQENLTSAEKAYIPSDTKSPTKSQLETTPTRNKSIFQSLRDRFTNENGTKDGQAAKHDAASEKGLNSSVSESANITRSPTYESAQPDTTVTKEGSIKFDDASENSESGQAEASLTHGSPKTYSRNIVEQPSVEHSVPLQEKTEELNRIPATAQDATSPSKMENGTVRSTARSVSSPKSQSSSESHTLPVKRTSFKVRKVSYDEAANTSSPPTESLSLRKKVSESEDDEKYEEDDEEDEIRQRQDYRKSMAAATFNFDLFDIDDPDNTLTQVLLYLEHQTVQVISTIQDLLSAIKKPDATRGELRDNSSAISEVISQMTEATNTSMNQTRNHQLKEHGSWVVRSLEDCNHRMNALCKPNADKEDSEFADRHFKQRLAGISFDIAKCTKELVKTVEEASLKEDIANLDARLIHADDLT